MDVKTSNSTDVVTTPVGRYKMKYRNKLIISSDDRLSIEEFDTEYIPGWDRVDGLAKTAPDCVLRLYFYCQTDGYGHVVWYKNQLLDESLYKSKYGDQYSPGFKQFINQWFPNERT